MLRIDISSLKHSSLSIPFTIYPSPSPFTSPPPPKHILRHFEARHQSEKKNYNKNSSCLVTVSQRHLLTILKLGINLKRNIPHKQIKSSRSPTHCPAPTRVRSLIHLIFFLYNSCLFQNHKYLIYVESFLQAI